MVDPLADAQAWYDRGQVHIAEYRKKTYEEKALTFHKDRISETQFRYSLRFNRDPLVSLKPIACEVGNALFQSLDNLIAVGARTGGVDRSPRISWPWAIEPNPDANLPGAVRPNITKKLKELAKEGLPQPWLDLIVDTFSNPAAGLQHIDVVKEVSLSGKHWELVPTNSTAHAIAWKTPGSTEQTFADIPTNFFDTNDEFIFHEGDEINTKYFETLMSTFLIASDRAFHPEPITAFGYTSRFVEHALSGARKILSGGVT